MNSATTLPSLGRAMILLFSLSACSTQQWYEHNRQHEISKCNRLPSGSKLEVCEKAIPPDYNDYKTERDALLEQDNHR